MKWDHENFENASVQMLRRRRRLIERAALAVEPQQRITDRSLFGATDDGIVGEAQEQDDACRRPTLQPHRIRAVEAVWRHSVIAR